MYLKTPGVNTSFVEDKDPLGKYNPDVDKTTKPWEQRKVATLWTS